MTTCTNSAGESSARSKPSSSASCCNPVGPVRPRQRLADSQAAVLERRDRLERRAPASHVVSSQETAFGGDEAIDLLGDEALVVGAPAPSRSPPRASRRGPRPGCGCRSRQASDSGRALRPRGGGRYSSREPGHSRRSSSVRSIVAADRRRRTGTPPLRSRSRTRARPRAATSRTARAGGASRRTRPARRPRGRPCPAQARARARGSDRSSPPRARRPGRRARSARPSRPATGAPAPRRRDRSGAARPPAA